MYEPITVEVDRGHGDGAHRSTPINFTGRLLKTVEGGRTTMRLYEWADRGRLVYLVHVVEEGKPGRPPRRTLYPFINTHSAGAAPTKGYTAEEVSRAYPEFERKCHDGGVRRLRDFASMADFFSDREIDELQAAIDARRGGRRGEHPRPASKEATDRPAAPLILAVHLLQRPTDDLFQPRPAVVGQVAGEQPRLLEKHAHVPQLR